jgi:hypothetical protein
VHTGGFLVRERNDMRPREDLEREELRTLMHELFGSRDEAVITGAAGIDPAALRDLLLGRRPPPEAARRLADHLNLSGELRARFFAACGYSDSGTEECYYEPDLAEGSTWSDTTGREVAPDDLEVVREEMARLRESRRP